MNPVRITTSEQMEKADGPPPDGSTATKKCATLSRWSRSTHTSCWPSRSSNNSTSSLRNSFSLPSADIPRVSRRLRTPARC
jgi:hypothetical protein